MCNNCHLEACCEFCDKRKIVSFKDKGNKQEYRVFNDSKNTLCKIKVDDCLLKEGNRCDYMMIKCLQQDNQSLIDALYFIELKGSDLVHALTQIETTINSAKVKKMVGCACAVYARVVLNKQRTPDLRSTHKIKFEKMIKKLGGNLVTQGKKMEEKL